MVGEMLAHFGKGLGAGLETGRHGHDKNGKNQNALAEKGIGFETRLIEQFVRVEVVEELDKNTLVLRPSW